jgi:hypothetical protein
MKFRFTPKGELVNEDATKCRVSASRAKNPYGTRKGQQAFALPFGFADGQFTQTVVTWPR